MKRFIAAMAAVTLLALGSLAYAHGPGSGGGHMMGQGSGGGHMSSGYGGHMMGAEGFLKGEEGQKFLNETYSLRKKMHDTKFELREALRNPDTTLETVSKLERDIQGIKEKLREKAPKEVQKRFGRDGGCWQQ